MIAAKTLPPPIIVTRKLTVEELKSLNLPLRIEADIVIIEKSLREVKLRQTIELPLAKVLAVKEKGLAEYIIKSLICDRPQLIPFVFDNQSVVKMARHFLRHCSRSHQSCVTYTVNVKKYSDWLGYSPDLIIKDVRPIGSIPDPIRLQNHKGYLDDYLAEIQDQKLQPGSVNNLIKSVKTFYRVNGAKIELDEPLSKRVVYKDRAPKANEVQSMLDVSDIREKFVVSMFALGGFRQGTFAKLEYRHVREDFENNIIPIHVHVEAEITKGKYHDYDTFLGAEAVQYLKAYLEQRKNGTKKIPPEILTDHSPLIRNEQTTKVKSLTEKSVRKIVRGVYTKADLGKKIDDRLFDLRNHSIRKYFETHMIAAGVPEDYIEYMMGHTVKTYHDIQSLGVEYLRNVYKAAGLSIRQKTQVNKVGTLKDIIRAFGMNPEQILTKDALNDGAATCKNSEYLENHQLQLLCNELKQIIRKEATV